MNKVVAVLVVFITMPIWIYLQYKILVLVNATELMWFLFWCYLPVSIIVAITQKLMETKK